MPVLSDPISMFAEKLAHAVARQESLLCVGLDPNPEMLPPDWVLTGDPLQDLYDWMVRVIEQTSPWVCAYKPTLGFYLALGAPGLALLESILLQIPASISVILDAKHGDLNTGTLIARTAFTTWGVDAITLNPMAGQDAVAPFLLYPDKGVFVLCSPTISSFGQDMGSSQDRGQALLRQIAEARAWGSSDQLSFELGVPPRESLQQIRAMAPERLFLLRSIWGSETNLEQILGAGLNAEGSGLLVPIPQDFLSASDLGDKTQQLRDRVNEIRSHVVAASSCDLWIPDLCLLNRDPRLELIMQLYDIGCILFGDYVQASGSVFPYYIDLRTIISNPQVFQQILKLYEQILKTLTFDRIAGIPYGSLPTATGLALKMNRPMIFPRKEVKAHGTRRLIEGAFVPGEKVVVVDDILISGKSAMEGAAKIQSAGLRVEDIVVLIDHEQGVEARLHAAGYRSHAVFKLSEITETLAQTGRLSEEQCQALAVHGATGVE